MNTHLSEANDRKVLFIEKMDNLKENQVNTHLERLDQIEARLWDVIKQMEMT